MGQYFTRAFGSALHWLHGNIERRLGEHHSDSCDTTRRLGGVACLAASAQCDSIDVARRLERRLRRMKNPAATLKLLRSMNSHD
jgi:predicted GIY-YIG superfamily endonuclease